MPSLRQVALILGTLVLFSVTGSEALAAPRIVVEPPQPFPSGDNHAPNDPDNRLPQVIGDITVVYPTTLMTAPVADRVWVAFVVDTTGLPRKVRAFFGQHPELEQAAVEAVQRARFSPGRHVGKNVHTQMTILVRFEIDS